jgi:hypothetical protein
MHNACWNISHFLSHVLNSSSFSCRGTQESRVPPRGYHSTAMMTQGLILRPEHIFLQHFPSLLQWIWRDDTDWMIGHHLAGISAETPRPTVTGPAAFLGKRRAAVRIVTMACGTYAGVWILSRGCEWSHLASQFSHMS